MLLYFDIFIQIAEFCDYQSILNLEYAFPKLLHNDKYKNIKNVIKKKFDENLLLYYKDNYVIGTLLLDRLNKKPLRKHIDIYFTKDKQIFLTNDSLRINEFRCYIYSYIFQEIFGLYFQNGLKIINYNKYLSNEYIFDFNSFINKYIDEIYRIKVSNKIKSSKNYHKKYIENCIYEILRLFINDGYRIYIKK